MATTEGMVLTFVLNALWQVPAVVAGGLLADRLLRRAPARQRHALWMTALALCVLLPAASLPISSSEPEEPGPALSRRNEEAWLAWTAPGESRQAPVPANAASFALSLYGLSLLFHGSGLIRSWRRARRLVWTAHSLEIPAAFVPAVDRCGAAMGMFSVEILGSPDISGPVTVGTVILLPSRFFDTASLEETVAALGHEIAHIRRRDYLLHLLGEALLLPIAFHPAVRVVRRRLAEAREMACDEAALEILIGRRAYARSLLSLAARSAGLPQPSFTLGVLDAHTLEVRMKRILDTAPRLDSRRARAALGATLLLLGGIGAAASGLSVQAVAKGGDLRPFVGTWSGDWAPDQGEKLRAVDLEIRPDGTIVETWYRHKATPSGGTETGKQSRQVANYKVAGRTLTLKVRIDDFAFQDRPPAVAEIEESLELREGNEGVFKVLSNSYFAAARKRGEPVPPPPPPISMKRQR
ncbi:MAG TPA: M56 family metallopeptidase [Thermoanaerobaculia bacterium]|nr:M56 family metallopeptidase [Thermoanaerobaculia bacterium]